MRRPETQLADYNINPSHEDDLMFRTGDEKVFAFAAAQAKDLDSDLIEG